MKIITAGGAILLLLLLFAAHALADVHTGYLAAKKGDYATAIKVWQPLAQQGNRVAQFNLGLLYAKGLGVEQDFTQALVWWQKSAQQKYRDAYRALGLAHGLGKGVPKDLTKAYMWLELAARAGGKQAGKLRDAVAKEMTPAQISQAKRMASDWQTKD